MRAILAFSCLALSLSAVCQPDPIDTAEGVQEHCRTTSTLSLATPANAVQRVRPATVHDSEANARQPPDRSDIVDPFNRRGHPLSLEVRSLALRVDSTERIPFEQEMTTSRTLLQEQDALEQQGDSSIHIHILSQNKGVTQDRGASCLGLKSKASSMWRPASGEWMKQFSTKSEMTYKRSSIAAIEMTRFFWTCQRFVLRTAL